MPSYEKNKSSGLWSCRFREINEYGVIHQRRLSGFATKREAQYGYEDYIKNYERLKEEKAAAEKKAKSDPNDLTFDELYKLYLDFKKSRLKESSYYDLEMKNKKWLLPYFSGKKMKEITPALVLEWQKSLSGYSYRYVSDLMSHLASIYNFSEKYHNVTNIMNKVDRPRNLEGKKEMQFWTPEEFEKVIAQIKSPDYKMLFLTLYITGCRRGEALALTWDDISGKNKTISISKSLGFKIQNNGKNYKVTTPKNTGSNRTIAVPAFLTEELQKYYVWQKANTDSQNFVFGGSDPLPPTSIARMLDNAAAAAGVKKIRIHDLRHSCASYLIHKGVSIVAVSRQLGHNNIEQTLNTYSHMLPDDRDMIRNTLDDLHTVLGTKSGTEF